jgi:Ser-tRNA(Ala) deacylase AlaX
VTDLLYLREPGRRQALAKVEGTRGPAFVLDRSLYYAPSHLYRHPQAADRGEVWIGGDKRVLTRVFWDRGELRHSVRGVTPPRGTAVNCHLDGDRRDAASAAHTAMHLVLSAFSRIRLGVLTAEPQVQGGRQFTIIGRFDASGPALKRLLDAANGTIERKLEVAYEFLPRDALHGVDAQPFEDGVMVPGDERVVRIVRIGDASTLPCDGTFVERTAKLGRLTVRSASQGRQGARVQFAIGKAGYQSQ